MTAQAARRARRMRTHTSSGFTLLEVLVAVAIVATSLLAGSRAASSVVDNAQRLSDTTLAQWCADNYLTEIRLTRRFPDIGEASFECTQLGQTFRGGHRVQGTPNPHFRRVDAMISDSNNRPLLTISTIVMRP